jgi:hypothetical protein
VSNRHLLCLLPLLCVLLAAAVIAGIPLRTECSVEVEASPGQVTTGGVEECRDISLIESETDRGWILGYLGMAAMAAGTFAATPRPWAQGLATALLAVLAAIGLLSIGWLLLPAVLACIVVMLARPGEIASHSKLP